MYKKNPFLLTTLTLAALVGIMLISGCDRQQLEIATELSHETLALEPLDSGSTLADKLRAVTKTEEFGIIPDDINWERLQVMYFQVNEKEPFPVVIAPLPTLEDPTLKINGKNVTGRFMRMESMVYYIPSEDLMLRQDLLYEKEGEGLIRFAFLGGPQPVSIMHRFENEDVSGPATIRDLLKSPPQDGLFKDVTLSYNTLSYNRVDPCGPGEDAVVTNWYIVEDGQGGGTIVIQMACVASLNVDLPPGQGGGYRWDTTAECFTEMHNTCSEADPECNATCSALDLAGLCTAAIYISCAVVVNT